MAFTGSNASVSTTIDEVVAHWAQVDVAVGGIGVVIKGNTLRSGFEAKRTEWVTLQGTLESRKNAIVAARGDVQVRKAALGVRLSQFGDRLRGLLVGSPGEAAWVGMLPLMPGEGESTAAWLKAMEDLIDVWTRCNATPLASGLPAGMSQPITLPGGYTLQNLTDDVRGAAAVVGPPAVPEKIGLIQLERAVNKSVKDLEVEFSKRNLLREELKDLVKSYRAMVPSFLPAGHALLATLPRYSPLPGHTPDPVVLSGVYEVVAGVHQARLSWPASTEPTLQRTEVRATVGESYDPDDDVLVATVLPGQSTEVVTSLGLGVPGSVVNFKAFVVLDTGNERGSNTVEVRRPA